MYGLTIQKYVYPILPQCILDMIMTSSELATVRSKEPKTDLEFCIEDARRVETKINKIFHLFECKYYRKFIVKNKKVHYQKIVYFLK